MKKFKPFQLLLLFLVTTFMLFAFSKGSFSETPSNPIPEQIEIPGYGKFLKQGEECFTLDGRKISPFKKESGSSMESVIILPQTQNNDQPSIQRMFP